MFLRLNLKVSCVKRATARAAALARVRAGAFNGSPFAACEWDDVAFRRAPGRRFCSARCEAAERESRSLRVNNDRTPNGPQMVVPDDLEARMAAHVVSNGRRLLDLSRQDQRRGQGRGHPVDFGPRRLELEMRTSDELHYRPPRRLKWIDTNLAVPETP